MDEDFDIEILRGAAAQGRIQWHQHALERFLERGVSRAEVVSAIMHGDVIEAYRRTVRIQVASFCTLRRSRSMWWPPPILPPGYVTSSRHTGRI